MAAMSGLMGASMAMNAASSISSGFSEAEAIKAKGQFESSMDTENAGMAELSADDAIARGKTAARLNMQKVRDVIGSQRAGLAAQGVDVNSGSAAKIQADTAGQGALDSMTIRNNAIREAMGYRVQALNYSTRAQFERMSANNEAGNTFLTGGLRGLSYGTQSAYWFNKG